MHSPLTQLIEQVHSRQQYCYKYNLPQPQWLYITHEDFQLILAQAESNLYVIFASTPQDYHTFMGLKVVYVYRNCTGMSHINVA